MPISPGLTKLILTHQSKDLTLPLKGTATFLLQRKKEPATLGKPDWTSERFVRENLSSVTKARWFFGKGPKRIRKKRARAWLKRKWFVDILGPAMVAPIRRQLNYEAIGRKVFSVEELPAGALPIYDNPSVGGTE